MVSPRDGSLDTHLDSPYANAVSEEIGRHRPLLLEALNALQDEAPVLGRIADVLIEALRGGHTILLAGNGGSAAEAQHFSAELVGRFRRERQPYAAVALTTDSSILTAVANDYSYADVFSRQVLALGRSGDVLLAFTTSGRSENLIRAADAAHAKEMTVVAVTGQRESPLSALADLTLRAPAAETPVVQEIHMLVTHLLCDLIEETLAQDEEQV